jgi:peptidyl-prolyl cis-trans isomerase A (cyclophilin A)
MWSRAVRVHDLSEFRIRSELGESRGEAALMAEELFATLNTTLGPIVLRLFPDKAPETVANFTGLADGSKPWHDPNTGKPGSGGLYNGTVFHRVIDGFMIQGGDPLGTGTGGPGYKFKDEFDQSLRFDRPYLLAMANAGPGTNGSQFFITVGPTPHLNDRHTIFGEVVQGTEVVDQIAKSPTDHRDRPKTDVVIESVTIDRR